ncbi:NAD-P-binding protein [Panus rudis PR-1116 ss-1]|nr:NAD-P-binding protein [Panus rudis PR-1116 ss-1]
MGSFFSKTFDPAKDIPDLSGKVVILTGGNSGIGYAAVQHLARRGAKVYMGARSEEKAKAAIERLKKEGLGPGNGEVIWLPLDLSDPKEAKKAAEDFLTKEKRLDVLINNAAIILTPYAKSHYGIQDIMVVNHLSPFVFTMTLLPLLKSTAQEPGSDVRIVNIASDAVRFFKPGEIHFRNREDFNDEHAKAFAPSLQRYARSKLANILFTNELQRRLDAEGVPIIVVSVHPGGVNTEGNRRYGDKLGFVLGPLYKAMCYLFFTPPEKGSYAHVFAAAHPAVKEKPEAYKAAYVVPPGKLSTPPGDGKSESLAKELWETTEKLLEEIGA